MQDNLWECLCKQSLEDSKEPEGHQILFERKEGSGNILIAVTWIVLESYWNMFPLSDGFQFSGIHLSFQKEY